MGNRKHNNSVLVLATLGVYFGLVFVGATPVMGHAAMTRHFEIQDEIEFKDDLDKKPDAADEERGNAITIGSDAYVETVRNYISGFQTIGPVSSFAPVAEFSFSDEIEVSLEPDPLTGVYSRQQFLLVTRLPRAGIDSHLAVFAE